METHYPSLLGINALICNVVTLVCKPVLVAPAYFILLLLLFCGFDVYSLSVAGFFPLVVFVSGFLFCYQLVLPCLFLPYFIRKIYKIFLLAMGVIYFAINFGLLYLYQKTFNFLSTLPNYRTFDENEALSIIARLSVNYKNKKEKNSFEISSFVQSCKFVTDYRTFKEDFLKVVDFVHYLRAEGYDMVTFDKVGNGIKS